MVPQTLLVLVVLLLVLLILLSHFNTSSSDGGVEAEKETLANELTFRLARHGYTVGDFHPRTDWHFVLKELGYSASHAKKLQPILHRGQNQTQPSVLKSAVVLTCNEVQLPRAFQTIRELRHPGAYTGDLILFGDGSWSYSNHSTVFDPLQITTIHFPPVNLTPLLEASLGKMSDRCAKKLFQWHKLYLFHPYFKQWDVILYIDAGATVFQPIQPFFTLDWKGRMLGHSDAHPHYNWRLGIQFDLKRDINITKQLRKEFGRLQMDYFSSSLMLFDTNLIQGNRTFHQLLELMVRFPISQTNDQAIINLLFTAKRKVYRPLPLKYRTSNGTVYRLYGFIPDKQPSPPMVIVKYKSLEAALANYK